MDSSSLFPLIRPQIACGLKHTMCVSDAGTLFAWGGGESNQLGNDRLKNISLPIRFDENATPESENENEHGLDRMCSKRLVQVACGSFHTVVVRTDGMCYSWGLDEGGLLGSPEKKNPVSGFIRIEGRPMMIYYFKSMSIRILHVSCGASHTLATDSSGDVYSWGVGNYGNLGHGDTATVDRPKLIDVLKGKMIKMTGAGSKHSLAISSKGDLFSFGHGDNGRLGNNERRGCLAPEIVGGILDGVFIVYCDAGEAHSAIIDDNGVLYMFGAGSYGRLGLGEESDALVPTSVDTLRKHKIVMVSCGAFHTMCITTAQELWGFGGRLYGKLGDGNSAGNAVTPVMIALEAGDGSDPSGFIQVSCGTFHTSALTSAGHIKTWGFDGQGQLGLKNNNFQNHKEPQVVHNLDSVQCTGMAHLHQEKDAKKSKSKLGKDGSGLAGGKLSNNAKSVICIAAGAQHTLACTVKGDVYSWGENRDGQLGRGADSNPESDNTMSRPVRVEYHISGKRVTKVAAGAQHSMCLTVRGDVYAWGCGTDGQLGIGKNVSESRPMLIQILQGKRVAHIACGENHSAATLQDGQMFTWGSGDMGKLGHGRVTRPQMLPRMIRGRLTKESVVTMSLGMSHTAAVTNTGACFIWGGGWFGRLGLGNNDNVYAPKKITALDYMFIVKISCGGYHTMALTKEGEVYTWGRGDERLGIGETPDVMEPTLVVALRQKQADIVDICASEEHSVVIASNGAVYAWGMGRYGKLGLSKGSNDTDADEAFNLPRDVLNNRGSVIQPLDLLRNAPGEMNIRMMSSHSNHTVALSQEGVVYAWGNKGGGRLGLYPQLSDQFAACAYEVADLSIKKKSEDDDQGTGTSGGGQQGSSTGGGKGGDGDGDDEDTGLRKKGGKGKGKDGGSSTSLDHSVATEAAIEYHMQQYKQNRVNPPCQFVQLLLETEPIDHRVEQLKLVESNLERKQNKIDQLYFDIHQEEEEVNELRNTIRLTIKSTLNEGVPVGLNIQDYSAGIPYEIEQDHSIYTEMFKLLLTNPMYLVEMYHFFIQEMPANKAACGGQFTKFFSDLTVNVYGDLSRPWNDHLFISLVKQLMMKEISQIQAKSDDLSDFASQFPDQSNVFGMIISHYFTLPKNVRNLRSRFQDLFIELASSDKEFQYDPLLVQRELSKGGSSDLKGGDESTLDQRRLQTYNTKTAIRNKVNERVDNLNEEMLKWTRAITGSAQTLPEEVRWICHQLHECLIQVYGLESNSAENFKYIVGSFLFKNYFRPVIMHPEKYGILPSNKIKISDKTRGNLRFISAMVEKVVSQAQFHLELKWLHSSNQKIASKREPTLKWVGELVKPDLDLPSQMVIDVYREHLRGTVRIVHTVPLMSVELLRWMLYTASIKNHSLGKRAKDPIDEHIRVLFGEGREDNRNKVNTWMDTGWLTCKPYGINYELDTKFYDVMDASKLVRENQTQVPLPNYLAPDDAAPLHQHNTIGYGIDPRKLALEDCVRQGVQVPNDSIADQVGQMIESLQERMELAIKQKEYDFQKQGEMARALLEEMSLQGMPLSEVMGELMTLVHQRAMRNKQLRRDHTNLSKLLSDINSYRGALENKKEALAVYLDLLQRGISDTQNKQQVAIIIKKKKNLGHLTSSTLVQDTHKSVKPTKLKLLLAKHKQVSGTHGEYSFADMKKVVDKTPVILSFSLVDDISQKELKEVKKKLSYVFSSVSAGKFIVTTVYDKDMVLDHFHVSSDELLTCKRQLVKEWSPKEASGNTFSKTVFSVFGLLRVLQKLTMKQIMLGQRLEHSKEELLVVKDVM